MFYKEKGFYISLICGIVCLAAFSFICMNVFSDGSGEQENAVVAQETQAPVMTEVPTATFSPEAEDATTDNVKSEVKEATPAPKKEKKQAKTTMKSNKTKLEDKLHFDQETGLLWPVEGDILIEYSPEKVVYFPTLSQFKTNPALIIGSKVGESVKSSSSGVVKNIETNDETGTTVTIAIGDDFKVVYGQLKDLAVSKGDEVSEGQVIGKIAKPTKYYSVEGANLYYQVKQKEETVNPLVLLR